MLHSRATEQTNATNIEDAAKEFEMHGLNITSSSTAGKEALIQTGRYAVGCGVAIASFDIVFDFRRVQNSTQTSSRGLWNSSIILPLSHPGAFVVFFGINVHLLPQCLRLNGFDCRNDSRLQSWLYDYCWHSQCSPYQSVKNHGIRV
jgi:hypothetical protein